ncbi:BON domain-containing protein [Streptomyces sp. AM8-1-1]|uniref:BON domain-containing protein n=1 Tax=Streptomyces sp. AM8-1-1 TaxID=3075825 RepID=UPI0028C46CE9|nr:BON domain-containing protein [Streptomyces sp. AM8-1-1]WNO70209.1 BON domain-containing protein [Streptomyces sp. AM8-1-1]
MRHDAREEVTDAWITTQVKAELLAGASVGREIKVETVNGVVTLTGSLTTQAERDRAVSSAMSVTGVTRVDASALQVEPSAGR